MSSDQSHNRKIENNNGGFDAMNNEDTTSEKVQQSTNRSRGRRRGGVATELPDACDVQQNAPSESQPGGAVFRAMTMPSNEPALLRMEAAPVYKSVAAVVAPTAASVTKSVNIPESKAWTESLSLTEKVPILKWNVEYITIQEVPMYFPKQNLDFEFPGRELDGVLTRVCEMFPKLSIQAKLRDSPLSAFLQTCENIELYVVFFHEKATRRFPTSMDPNSRKIFMSVQRHKGDQMIANQYHEALINAAKGIRGKDGIINATVRALPMHRSAPNAEALLQVERLIVRSCEVQEDSAMKGYVASSLNQTPKEMIKSSINQLYAWVQHPKRLDNRQHILEYLIVMTDVKRTMSSSAIAGALVVLQGYAPDMTDQAKEIQKFFLTILQHRALSGDRSMFEGMNIPKNDSDNDIEMRAYFPEESEVTQGYPAFFVEYMNKMFHLCLQVLAQSLVVVECFQKQIVQDGWNIHDLASDFLFAASDVTEGRELYTTLLECISHAETKLANAYLACKIVRLLALAYPPLTERLKLDDNARLSIQNAFNIGKVSHTLLMEESRLLWDTVRNIPLPPHVATA